MFANTIFTISTDDSSKAQKSQKERQRRERESNELSEMKQFLLDENPNIFSKMEKADVLQQANIYLRTSKQYMYQLEKEKSQWKNESSQWEYKYNQLENILKDVMSAGLLQASPSSEESFSPDRMIRSEILYDDSINSSPTNTSSDDMDCSSVEMSPVGLMISGNTTPHLPRKHNLPRNISSKSESVWHPWE